MGQMNLNFFNAMSRCEHVAALKNKFFLYSYTCFYTYFEKKNGAVIDSVLKRRKGEGEKENAKTCCSYLMNLSTRKVEMVKPAANTALQNASLRKK